MNYKTMNKIGKLLEVGGAVSLALIVGYDVPPESLLVPVGLFLYGSGLRDQAIRHARIDGMNETIEANCRKPRSDLSDEADGENLPFLP